MSDWWTKKLAGEKPASPRPGLPPVEVPMRFPAAVTAAAQPQHVHQQQQEPVEQPESFSEALRLGHTKGGEATRRETMNCPDCGSQYVFSRTGRGANTMVAGAAPAPRCYECGWNGLYDQASQASWS